MHCPVEHYFSSFHALTHKWFKLKEETKNSPIDTRNRKKKQRHDQARTKAMLLGLHVLLYQKQIKDNNI